MQKKDVIDYILNHSREEKLIKYISSKIWYDFKIYD